MAYETYAIVAFRIHGFAPKLFAEHDHQSVTLSTGRWIEDIIDSIDITLSDRFMQFYISATVWMRCPLVPFQTIILGVSLFQTPPAQERKRSQGYEDIY